MDKEYWVKVLTEAAEKGMSAHDIAQQEHYNVNSIYRFAREAGVKLCARRKKQEYWAGVLTTARKNHLPINQVAEAEGVTTCDILYWERMTGIRLRRLRRYQPPRTIVQLTLDGTEIARYKSACEAARMTGIAQGGISTACNGVTQTCHGYRWRYE